jgi:hypothetical protein
MLLRERDGTPPETRVLGLAVVSIIRAHERANAV